MKNKLVRLTMAPLAPEPADGSADATQPQEPATQPQSPDQAQPANQTPDNEPKAPKADNKLPPAKAQQNDKNTLLGEAVNAGQQTQAGADGDANKKPDGGKTGDGQQQDPFAQLKAPEGAVLDETQLGNYKKLAQEMGLNLSHAQKLLDFEAQRLTQQQAQAAAVWKQQTQEKYGAQLTETVATAARAVEKLGGDELRQLLDQTGLGNHPILVEAFYKAGALLKEDVSVPSNAAAAGDKTFTEALYGSRSK